LRLLFEQVLGDRDDPIHPLGRLPGERPTDMEFDIRRELDALPLRALEARSERRRRSVILKRHSPGESNRSEGLNEAAADPYPSSELNGESEMDTAKSADILRYVSQLETLESPVRPSNKPAFN
jgi:hypothetical protein